MSQDFIIKIRVILAKHDKTQSWLADQINISRPYMTDIMKGRRKPDKQVKKINAVLDELEKEGS